jgi:hypothetical protein
MAHSDHQPLIDRPRLRAQWVARHQEFLQHPERASILHRSRVHLIRDYLKEARIAQHIFRSDEDPPMGGGEAPRPLRYFSAGAGF